VAESCGELARELVIGPKQERDPAKALCLAKKAAELMPGEWKYFHTLGVVYYRLGRYRGAVEELERSSSQSEGESTGFDSLFLAMCYARLGDAAKAKDYYERAVQWTEEQQHRLQSNQKKELDSFRAEAEAVLQQSAEVEGR
jgi:lipopolysaccharide biosynthesis regulator YciM